MKRKEFIKQIGVGAAVFCAGGLAACERDQLPVVDFKVDLSDAKNPLNTVGKSELISGVLIVHDEQDHYLAVLSACTHAGANIEYDDKGVQFICPKHGAQFNKDGVVTKGPAALNLRQYKTRLETINKKRTLIVFA